MLCKLVIKTSLLIGGDISMQRLLKNFERFVYVLIGIFVLWVIVSWGDVLSSNMFGTQLHLSWNAFVIFERHFIN